MEQKAALFYKKGWEVEMVVVVVGDDGVYIELDTTTRPLFSNSSKTRYVRDREEDTPTII